jgi:nickel-dependent lactate racemase
LGTHPILTRDQILELYGLDANTAARDFPKSEFFSHLWDRQDTFCRLGEFSAAQIEEISGGLISKAVPIDINKSILDYDLVVILGPVFPHEVVGFSGGAKYLFPGISGGDFLHFFHWLGALVTCRKIIGRKDTPVRSLIHQAMKVIPVPLHCLSLVVDLGAHLRALFVGDPVSSWSDAADIAASLHVKEVEKPYQLVIGRAPAMYDELWTAGKVMYKLEQVVADGGTLVIYAPHVREVSRTWGGLIEKVGYHVRDYLLARWEEVSHIPLGVLAHSTHVRGDGTYRDGSELPRINVILATAIPEETCRLINLGYMHPDSINLDDYRGREREGILLVDHAGEVLWRLRPE